MPRKLVVLSQLMFIIQSLATCTQGSVLFVAPNENVTTLCNKSFPCASLNTYARGEIGSHTVLVFAPGEHFLQTALNLKSLVNVTLQGSNELTSSVSINSSGSIVLGQCEDVTIENMVLKWSGGGVDNTVLSITESSDVSLVNVHFHGNRHMRTSALTARDSSITFTDVRFARCSSLRVGGGISAFNSALTFIRNNTFTGNSAGRNGGALHLHSCEVRFSGVATFTDNTAGVEGGAIAAKNSSIIFMGPTTFEYNSVTTFTSVNFPNTTVGGGALYLDNSEVELADSVTFGFNSAPNGGAILAIACSLLMSHGNVTFGNNTATSEQVSRHCGDNTAGKKTDTSSGDSCIHTIKEGHGRGGGISLNNSTAFLYSSSSFYNNTASFGGSIYSATSNLNLTDHTTIGHSLAETNGGGIYVYESTFDTEGLLEVFACTSHLKGSAIYVYNSTAVISDTVRVRDCFQSDMELEGTLYFERSKVNFSGQTLLVNNSAYEGGGAYLLDSTVRFTGDTQVINNTASLNGGGLYLDKSRTGLFNSVLFQGNQADVQGGSVYVSIGSILFMSGEATHKRNSAGEGGVLAFENGGSMVLSSPLHFNAIENSAILNGGVIYYTDVISTTDCAVRLHSDFRPLPMCFVELNSTLPFNISILDITINYTRNRAGTAGSILYGGNLERCRILVSEKLRLESDNKCEVIQAGHYEDNPFELLMNISMNRSPNRDEIGSAPLTICFCEDGIPDCSITKNISIMRGETFHMSAMTLGQLGGAVPSTIRTDTNSTVEINTLQRQQKTNSSCTDISYQVFTNDSSTILTLYPDGPCRDTGIARKEIHVTLLDCPDGFNQSISGKECICEDRLLALNASCNIDERSIQVEGGTWVKGMYINDSYTGVILHRNCPFDYCVNTPTNVTLDNPDVLCNHNRTGILCGACKANYSLALGSFNCLRCSNRYLSLLILFAAAGIVLVIFLLVLDLTVAKGMINGLIIYANIVQANKAVFFPKQQQNVLTVFIAWLNLDLGIESCFSDGLSAYTHTWLQFVFPFYVWFLISLIIFFSHKSRTVTRLLSTNPVAVLATLLLMSYAKVLRTIISALSRTYLDTPYGLQTVWIFDGNMRYLHSLRHGILALVAVLALAFLFLPYSLLLMFGWKLQYHSGTRVFSWISKLKPFMDTIYGPFRTDTRYWTGLLVVIRCILFLIFAFNGVSPNAGSSISTNLLAILMVFAGLAVVAWLNGRIYIALYNDFLEAAYILNITIFAAATYHIKVINGDQAILAHISLSIAFILFIGVVLFHIYLRVENRSCWKRLQIEITLLWWYEKVKKLLCRECQGRGGRDESISVQNEEVELSEQEKEPTTSYVTLRKPLLES